MPMNDAADAARWRALVANGWTLFYFPAMGSGECYHVYRVDSADHQELIATSALSFDDAMDAAMRIYSNT